MISQTTIVSEKSIVLPFYPYKSIRDQLWPCHKICQGQPRVISWTNLVVLKHLMLHTNFQGHRPFGSEEDLFLSFFTINGHDGHLVDRLNKLLFPHPMEAPYEIWLTDQAVSEEKMFKEYRRQRTEAHLSYKLTSEVPQSQVAEHSERRGRTCVRI